MRRQLPVYSPTSFTGVARAMFARRTASSELRDRLAAKYGVDPSSVTLTGTGTQALGLAIGLAVRARRVRRVALPAYTCWDVGSAAQAAGTRITYYDIDPSTLAPDLESLGAAVRTDVAAVVVGPLFGYSIDWDDVRAVCDAHGCLLIEDAAQGQGSVWRDRPVGGFGDATMLSFGRGKGWTGGAGGALLVRSEDLAAEAPAISLPDPSRGSRAKWSAAALAQAVLGRPSLYGVPAAVPGIGLGETLYHPPSTATAMLSSTAALVLSTEPSSEREAEERRRAGTELIARLDGIPGVEVIVPSRPGTGFLRLGARIPDTNPTWQRAARALGIERAYPLALPDVSELQNTFGVRVEPSDFPGARALARDLFSVPTHSLLTERDLNRIVTVLSDR